MHFNWNTAFGKVLATSFVALTASTSLYAIPRGPCEPKAPEVCCDEPKPGPFAFAYPMDMNLSCPRDFYFHIDGLAFQAKEDGLEFVIADTSTATSGTISGGRVEGFSNDHSDYDYNPGVRFGIGFYLDHDAWNLDFNWTWINITNYKAIHASTGGGGLIPLWILGGGTPALQIGAGASAVWDTAYDTFDIRLAKPYHVSRYLVFNPHFGLRAGWIDQHYSVDFGGTGAGQRTISHNDNDFWGIGARAGIDTDWQLGKGWCLFGNVAASMLFGKFEIDQNLTIPGGDGYDIKFDYYQNVPNVEIALGMGWGRFFKKGQYHAGLRVAYEFHEWFDQLNLRKFFGGASGTVAGAAATNGAYPNDVVSRGNLTLNGFSLKFQLDL